MRVAKEVGVRLNNELDILDEKRAYFEQENRQLKEELQASQNCRIQVENELGRVKLEVSEFKIFDANPRWMSITTGQCADLRSACPDAGLNPRKKNLENATKKTPQLVLTVEKLYCPLDPPNK